MLSRGEKEELENRSLTGHYSEEKNREHYLGMAGRFRLIISKYRDSDSEIMAETAQHMATFLENDDRFRQYLRKRMAIDTLRDGDAVKTCATLFSKFVVVKYLEERPKG